MQSDFMTYHKTVIMKTVGTNIKIDQRMDKRVQK